MGTAMYTFWMKGVNPNFFGMIDQRVASRGRVFVGTYTSTFSGYIIRMRGYHSQLEPNNYSKNETSSGGGLTNTYYLNPAFKYAYHKYQPIAKPPLCTREYARWRDLDHDIEAVP